MGVFADMPRSVRAAIILLAVALAAFTAVLALHAAPGSAGEQFEKLVSNVVVLGSALLCGWRAVAVDRERIAWALFAAGLALWGLGDLYFTVALWDLPQVPVPSPADGLYLALYPLAYGGIVVLFGSRLAQPGRSLWVDGLIGALSVAAFAATLLFDAVVSATGGSPTSVATNLAYPLADLLLVSFVFAALAMTGWSVQSAWAWLAAGLCTFAATDVLYLYGTAAGTYHAGAIIDAGWPLAALVIAVAAWLPAPAARRPQLNEHWRTITLPLGFGLASLGLLVYDHFQRVNPLAIVLAGSAMLAVLVRLALTFADNLGMLARSRDEALTDALTGLGNRRALLADLDRLLAGADAGRSVLALFDLDGFKHYNDSFGHPAGDALLTRVGRALSTFVDAQDGRAYRIGGDEFCALCPAGAGAGADVDHLVAEAAFTLTERGDGFAVGCSFGSIIVPDDAADAEAALRIVDQRMYEHKHGGRMSASRQSKDVLRRALFERDPDLDRHGGEVATLAGMVAERLGLPAREIETVRLAAELSNIGTVAVPDSILRKPAALDDDEASFVHGHPIIGERILSAAPALSKVARIVRSSHERVDGRGYPDGLGGDAIPLEARIVFVCDSYVAMRSERPHAASASLSAALAELSRCAGSQFDPAVVAALRDVVSERVSRPGNAGSSRA